MPVPQVLNVYKQKTPREWGSCLIMHYLGYALQPVPLSPHEIKVIINKLKTLRVSFYIFIIPSNQTLDIV